MKILLSILLIMGAAWHSNGQGRLVAYSIPNNEIHHLKVPQRMKISYMGVLKYYQVEGITNDGLVTTDGTISLDQIDGMHASRYVNKGKQGLGVFLTVLGGLMTAGGIALAADGWLEPGAVIVSILGGIVVTAGGISLAATRRNYEPEKWQFETLPENKWGERIITQSILKD